MAAGGFQGELVVRNYRQEALAFRWAQQSRSYATKQHPSWSVNAHADLCWAAAPGCELWQAVQQVCSHLSPCCSVRVNCYSAGQFMARCAHASHPGLEDCPAGELVASCAQSSHSSWTVLQCSLATLALGTKCRVLPCSSRITLDENGITNAIEISQQGADTPRLITSNNDKLVRVFDSQSFQITR